MTTIEWTEATWNPTRGCSVVSPGCANCYAMKQAHRFSGEGQPYEGLTKLTVASGPQWTGEVRFVPEMLAHPLRWKKPRMVFVNSMSDVFHEGVTDEQIAAIFGVMAACPQHTFQLLTKRPKRMREWFRWLTDISADLPAVVGAELPDGLTPHAAYCVMSANGVAPKRLDGDVFVHACHQTWPLSNVWLGTSAEDQRRWDERVPVLIDTPAAVWWVSAEPLLGPIDGTKGLKRGALCECDRRSPSHERCTPVARERWIRCNLGLRRLDWVVVGSESGPKARPMDDEWARSIVQQCQAAGVACFVKQVATREGKAAGDRKGGDPTHWPPELRVRQYPEVRREA